MNVVYDQADREPINKIAAIVVSSESKDVKEMRAVLWSRQLEERKAAIWKNRSNPEKACSCITERLSEEYEDKKIALAIGRSCEELVKMNFAVRLLSHVRRALKRELRSVPNKLRMKGTWGFALIEASASLRPLLRNIDAEYKEIVLKRKWDTLFKN